MTIMYRKILITILATAIALLCCGVDLSAQERKEIKKWEISGYFGAGGNGRDGPIRPFYFNTYCIGVGLEYYFTPRISLEGEINYLPHLLEEDNSIELDMYRILGDINLLFYFDLTKIKRPTKLFLTLGMGYQYDREEITRFYHTTMEKKKYVYESFWFQFINFGAGLKMNISDEWALRLLYKIHRFPAEYTITKRLAFGLSYRF